MHVAAAGGAIWFCVRFVVVQLINSGECWNYLRYVCIFCSASAVTRQTDRESVECMTDAGGDTSNGLHNI